MDYFDSKAIESITTIPIWIDAIEKAMKISAPGGFVMPQRMHLDHGNDTFLLMPCITDEYWATKLVSFCPGNKDSGRPSIYGTVVLNNSKTGEPLAIMDGGMITAMRTAAVTAVGIKHLSPFSSYSLGIIGTGTQGIFQVLFACSVREIKEVWAFDQNTDNLKKFSAELRGKLPGITIHCAVSSVEVALNSEVIIAATNSRVPVFPDSKELFTGRTFVGIGSYKPGYSEFPEQLLRQLSQVFVDTLDGKKESGDLITPIVNHWISEENIITLGNLISGADTLSANPTRLFKTVGSAIFDLFAAKLVYETNLSAKRGQE